MPSKNVVSILFFGLVTSNWCEEKNAPGMQEKTKRASEGFPRLAETPDLGFQNQRFQNIAFHCKKESFYERKSRVSAKPIRTRMENRKPLILAQILAHRSAELGVRRYRIGYQSDSTEPVLVSRVAKCICN
jgi:hypothetical protein